LRLWTRRPVACCIGKSRTSSKRNRPISAGGSPRHINKSTCGCFKTTLRSIFHTDVLHALEAQICPRFLSVFEYARPLSWPDPTKASLSSGELPVQNGPLPTYTSCLARSSGCGTGLKQEAPHLSPCAGHWKALTRDVRGFLGRFTEGSGSLLEYTGVSGA